MAEHASAPRSRDYRAIAGMWVRASLAYPLSFWIMTIGGGLITALDFVGLVADVPHHRRPRRVLAHRDRAALRRHRPRASASPTC